MRNTLLPYQEPPMICREKQITQKLCIYYEYVILYNWMSSHTDRCRLMSSHVVSCRLTQGKMSSHVVSHRQMSSHTRTDVVSHTDRCTLISTKYFFVSRQMSSHRTDVVSPDRCRLTYGQMSSHRTYVVSRTHRCRLTDIRIVISK